MDYNPQKQKEYKKIKTTLKELRVILGHFSPWVLGQIAETMTK